MERVNVAEARARLEELISRAAAGETIVIARDDAQGVRLEPEARRMEAGAGQFDWDAHAVWLSRQPLDDRGQQDIIDEWKRHERY